MGRTTLELSDELLKLAMRLTGAKTKTEVIDLALRELIRHRERDLLRRELGSFDIDLGPDELRRLRRAG